MVWFCHRYLVPTSLHLCLFHSLLHWAPCLPPSQVLSQDIYGLSKIKESLDSFRFLMTWIWTLYPVFIGLFPIPSFKVRSEYK